MTFSVGGVLLYASGSMRGSTFSTFSGACVAFICFATTWVLVIVFFSALPDGAGVGSLSLPHDSRQSAGWAGAVSFFMATGGGETGAGGGNDAAGRVVAA